MWFFHIILPVRKQLKSRTINNLKTESITANFHIHSRCTFHPCFNTQTYFSSSTKQNNTYVLGYKAYLDRKWKELRLLNKCNCSKESRSYCIWIELEIVLYKDEGKTTRSMYCKEVYRMSLRFRTCQFSA